MNEAAASGHGEERHARRSPAAPSRRTSKEQRARERQRRRAKRAEALRWPRFWARQIDAGFCLAAALTIAAALGVTPHARGSELFAALLYGPPLLGLCQLAYEALLLTVVGTTVGKAIMGLRVQTQYSRRIEFARACGRSASVWLHGSYACVMFPLLTALAWTRGARDLKARGSTSWDAGWDTEVVGAPLTSWRLWSVAAAAIAASGVVIALQIQGPGMREAPPPAVINRSIGVPAATSEAVATAAATAAPDAAQAASPPPFPINSTPGRPNMNETAETLALWAERRYPFLAADGPPRQAMFAWMVQGTQSGLPRNHALALGIDIVVSGLESGNGVCWPGKKPDTGDAAAATSDGKPVLSMRCER